MTKEFLERARRNAEKVSFVECDGCKICCHDEDVIIDEMSESAADYDTVPNAAGGNRLRRTDAGACVYLGPEGCTIYEQRPLMCRAFDCVQWLYGFSRNDRKTLIKQDGHDGTMARRATSIYKSKQYPAKVGMNAGRLKLKS